MNDEDLRHGETLRAFCHGRMPELLQPGYRFRPTGRQLLLLRDGRAGCCQFSPMILSVSAITVPIIAFVFALLSILRSDYVTGAGRVTWIVVCFCFPRVGPIVWFIAGKSTGLN